MTFKLGSLSFFSGPKSVPAPATPDLPKPTAPASYKERAGATTARQDARYAQANGRSTAAKLHERAKVLVNPKANQNPVGFQAAPGEWKTEAAGEITATFLMERQNRSADNFDPVAMAKAIALMQHERTALRDPKSAAAQGAKNHFPGITSKEEAHSAAIAELFKAVNQDGREKALDSFKYAEKGYLHKYETIAAGDGVRALGVLSQIAGQDPTAQAIIEGLRLGGRAGVVYLHEMESGKRKYFSGVEELAPTVVPKMTESTAQAKNIYTASRNSRNLADANEVVSRLSGAVGNAQDFLEKRGGTTFQSLQLTQKSYGERKQLIQELEAALHDGGRVRKAEQEFKNASRKEDITGESLTQSLVQNSKRAANAAGMISALCGAGPIGPGVALAVQKLIDVGYQMGGGAAKDGIEALMKTLESALKSEDLIDTSKSSHQQIARQYGEYEKVLRAHGEGSPQEKDARQVLAKALDGVINIDVVNKTLVPPATLRMENGRKLLEGEFSKVLDKAQKLEKKFQAGELDDKGLESRDKAALQLKQLQVDLVKVDRFAKLIDAAVARPQGAGKEAAMEKAFAQAGQLLGEVQNEGFRKLFTGDMREQMVSLRQANKEHLGRPLPDGAVAVAGGLSAFARMGSFDSAVSMSGTGAAADLPRSSLSRRGAVRSAPVRPFNPEDAAVRLASRRASEGGASTGPARSDSGYASLSESQDASPSRSRRASIDAEQDPKMRMRMLKINPALTGAAETVQIDLTGAATKGAASAVHVPDDAVRRLIEHGVVPKALNLSVDGRPGVQIDLSSTAAYYKEHIRTKSAFGEDGKSQIWKEQSSRFAKDIGRSLFGAPARYLAVQTNMKATREARQMLPDEMLKAEALLNQLKAGA